VKDKYGDTELNDVDDSSESSSSEDEDAVVPTFSFNVL